MNGHFCRPLQNAIHPPDEEPDCGDHDHEADEPKSEDPFSVEESELRMTPSIELWAEEVGKFGAEADRLVRPEPPRHPKRRSGEERLEVRVLQLPRTCELKQLGEPDEGTHDGLQSTH